MIAVVVVIPVVVVFETTVRTVPIPGVEAPAVVTRSDPMRALIRRARPVAPMPDIVAAYGIPIAIDPEVAGSGTGRHNVMARRRRRSNLNADGHLRCGVMRTQQEH